MRKAASLHILLLFANLSLSVGCSSHTGGYFSETKLPIFSYIKTSLASTGVVGNSTLFRSSRFMTPTVVLCTGMETQKT